MARYGLSARDVLDAVEVAIGGKNVSVTIEGRERFPIQVRVERSERDDIEKLGRILIATRPGMAPAAPAPASGGMGGGGMAVLLSYTIDILFYYVILLIYCFTMLYY